MMAHLDVDPFLLDYLLLYDQLLFRLTPNKEDYWLPVDPLSFRRSLLLVICLNSGTIDKGEF